MTEPEFDLEHDVLDWLVDSDESPWIIHTEQRRHRDPDVSVDSVIDALQELERRGWVEQRIPEENVAEALEEYRRYAASRYWRSKGLFQEYGPWYAITDAGRAEWERVLGS